MGALEAEAKVIARQMGTAAFELVTAGTEVSYGVGAMFILAPDAVDYALVHNGNFNWTSKRPTTVGS